MKPIVAEKRPGLVNGGTFGPWMLAAGGLALFHLAWLWQGDAFGYWLPGVGLGIALISWLGWRILPLLAIDLFLVRWQTGAGHALALVSADALLHSLLIGLSWWLYHHLAQGSRWLDDPRSATVFLILVPGGLAVLTAVSQAFLWRANGGSDLPIEVLAARFWLSRIVGVLTVVPFLIVVVTRILLRFRLVDAQLPPAFFGEDEHASSRFGERLELVGLTFATSVLALLLLWARAQQSTDNGMLWASCLVLIVWTCIRQGLFGGCFSAGVTSFLVLLAAQLVEIPPGMQGDVQGNLLAFCSSALLVGVSASWIRANETRYRHVVSRIPFVVYSARLPYGLPFHAPATNPPRPENKIDHRVGPSMVKLANVLLVSPASRQVFGREPESLIGPFERWLELIEPADRELVVASLMQLCLQKQPVTCEYRLRPRPSETADSANHRAGTARSDDRWVRDTLTPHYSDDTLVDGWEGLIEDITEQRTMSHDLRKMTNMLQVLITNLPTGVYFVQAPLGHPVLVNARARQLLGKREDLSAGLSTLSRVYRLHRQDGTEYPWEELPVTKALRNGVTCRANDIVLHRADGRKVPLITWAAPIDLHNTGTPDAAVWVLEDWSAMQQAETALRESELRLRAIIETMVEGVIVQDAAGAVIDCNASACAILGVTRAQMLSRQGLTGGAPWLRADQTTLPGGEEPDRQALERREPMRNVIVGMPVAEGIRWLFVNSLPLPVGPIVGLNPQKARVVTTFADITAHLQAQETLRLTKDRYQNLVESLPLMLLQRDREFKIAYLNPAATALTGYTTEEMMQPKFLSSLVHPDDQATYFSALQGVTEGKSSRVEIRCRVKDGSQKTFLGFLHPNFQDGVVVGSTSLILDTTMQRRLEEELQRAKHLELVGRLASGTVHDFNNLLTVLMTLAGVAKTELADTHPAWQYLTRIEDVGEQASHLTGQLLTFSKQRPRQSVPVDVNLGVAQTLKMAKSVMPVNIDVATFLDETQPLALGDENQFKQILMNLCLNARDAMEHGGKLTIRSDRDSPPNAGGAVWVHLAIQDTGIGMDEPVRARVFEPFFSTKEHGTGLGLAVVQQIITEAGGRIDVWSRTGEGTRFDIWLPGTAPLAV